VRRACRGRECVVSHTATCECGRELRVSNDLLGQRIRCPECVRLLTVPPTAPEGPGGPGAIAVESALDERAVRFRPEPGAEGTANDFWTGRGGRGGALIVLSIDRLFETSLYGKDWLRVVEALKIGMPADEIDPKPANAIRCDRISHLETNLHDRFLKVSWKDPPEAEEQESWILCPDKECRDEIFQALAERLGPGWTRNIHQETLLEAITPPLFVIAVAGVLTVGLALTANWLGGAELRAPGGRWGRLLGLIGAVLRFLGPVGVTLIGAPLVIVGLIWFVMRYRQPPRILSLTSRPAASPKLAPGESARKSEVPAAGIFLPDEPVENLRKSAARDETWILVEYKRRLRRQVIVPVVGIILIGLSFLIGGSDAAKIAAVLVIVPLFGFTIWNWRCPACNGYLGKGSNHSFCPKCRARLKKL
jgi:hypothetical protein